MAVSGIQVPWQTFASAPKQDLEEGILKKMKRKEKKPEGLCGIVFSSHAIRIVKKKKNCDYFSTSNQKTKSVSYIRINGQIDV